MTEKSEVVRTLFEYRDELGRRELSLLKRMARLWRGVEKEVSQEAVTLAQAIIQQAESGQTITPQYVYSLQRYKEFAQQAKIEIDYYDKNIIELITKSQLENMNLGLEAANKAILQSYPIGSPSWTQLNISAFETMAGMLGDGTPLSRLISRDYPFAIEQINQALINGVTLGKGYKQVADDMVMASRMAFERSVLIARTEINRAYRLANTEQYRQSGVVTGFKRLVYKPTACFACLMMDGEYLGLDQELYDHPRGKCSAVPVTIGGNTAQWQTGHEWFLEQSPEDQRRIMGPGRFDLWESGQIRDLHSFATMKPNEIWGPAPHVISIKDLPEYPNGQPIDFRSKNPQRVGTLADLRNFYSVDDPGISYATSKPVIFNEYVSSHLNKDDWHRRRLDLLELNQSDFIRAIEEPEYIEKKMRVRDNGHYSVTHFVRISSPLGKQDNYLGVAISLSSSTDEKGYHMITTVYSRPTRNILDKNGILKGDYVSIK